MNHNKKHIGERPLIVVGPDGKTLRMQEDYQNPENWKTLETDSALLLVARPQSGGEKKDLLTRILTYIDEHLAEKLTLRTVAGAFGVSVSTVTQLFQNKYGTTFHRHLTQRRMQAAQELIHSGIPLEEAGKLVGYVDHSTFYRAFRQVFGVSPREYRRKLNA